MQCHLESQGQHCLGYLLVQCCSKSIKTTLNRIFSCALLSGASWITLHKVFACIMLAQWLTDNFYEENNLYKVVSTIMGQHCIGALPSQCCANTSETTLHKKYLSNIGAERTDMFLQENNLYNVALICLCQRCTRKLCICAMFNHSP